MSRKQGILQKIHDTYPKYLPDGSTVRRYKRGNVAAATLKSVFVGFILAEILIIITSCVAV